MEQWVSFALVHTDRTRVFPHTWETDRCTMSNLTINTCAELSILVKSEGVSHRVPLATNPLFCRRCIHLGGNTLLAINAPIRRECLRETRIVVEEQRELCELILSLMTESWSTEKIIRIGRFQLNQLSNMGILVNSGTAPNTVQFRCNPRDEDLLELLPKERPWLSSDIPAKDLVVNEHIFRADELKSLGEREPDVGLFGADDAETIWVDDPRTEILSPYWIGAKEKNEIRDLAEGRIELSSISANVRDMLARASILVPRDWGILRERQRTDLVDLARKELRNRHHAVIRGLISPLQIAALRRYFRELRLEGFLREERSTRLVGGRCIIHNERVTRSIHRQMLPLMQRITGEEIKLSYSMLAVYGRDAFLRRHVDREQCVWSLSLSIDIEPEKGLSPAWPLYLGSSKTGVQKVELGVGDCVLFRGKKVPHWRDQLRNHELATFVFFHFVPMWFDGVLD